MAVPARRRALGESRAEDVVVQGVASGEQSHGPLNVVTRRDHRGRPRAAILPRCRILLRLHAPDHCLVVADLERELSTRELDLLNPEARVQRELHDPRTSSVDRATGAHPQARGHP